MKKLVYAFVLLFATAVAAAQPVPLDAFPQASLEIATPDARLHRFKIWIAQDDMHREQGLMFVKDLPAESGMLFIYPSARHVAMWMKNTLIPLDMVFIRADGRVSSVAANTKPLSLDNIESTENVVAVLELKGGTAAALNIRKGAIVIHQVFGTASKASSP